MYVYGVRSCASVERSVEVWSVENSVARPCPASPSSAAAPVGSGSLAALASPVAVTVGVVVAVVAFVVAFVIVVVLLAEPHSCCALWFECTSNWLHA